MYRVFAVRYGSRPSTKASEYYNFAEYREPDGPSRMDYFVFVARDRDRTVLVDTGYSLARARRAGRFASNDLHRDAVEALSELGVAPSDVDHVVLSHLHLDHMGNIDRFPRADFTVSRAEWDFWMTGYGTKRVFGSTVDPDELRILRELHAAGRVRLVEDAAELYPGLSVARVPGHTPGLLITRVAGSGGEVVLVSDGAHFYEEFDRDRPFWLFSDVEAVYRSFEMFRGLQDRAGVSVVPGHDPRIMTRFAPVIPERIVDLTDPVLTGS